MHKGIFNDASSKSFELQLKSTHVYLYDVKGYHPHTLELNCPISTSGLQIVSDEHLFVTADNAPG